MPFTTLGKNAMLNNMGIDRVGAFDADPGRPFTGENSDDTVDALAHGYSNGNLVVLSGLTGGSNLKTGYPYFVVNAALNTFQLALTPGGAAVNFGSDVTAGTVTRLVELSGGSPAYARKAIAFNAAADGALDDSTNGVVLDIPAGATVDWVGFWNNAAGELRAVDQVAAETYTGQGTYSVTDADFDLNQQDA
jgi:hypothetical protein